MNLGRAGLSAPDGPVCSLFSVLQDEDPDSSWLLLCEEDLISLLSQFPFRDLYSHMLGISRQGEPVCLCLSVCRSYVG